MEMRSTEGGHETCVDISWLLSNASDMRIKDIGSHVLLPNG